MFKRSHIELSEYLADEIQAEKIIQHKTSLGFGSVQPDLSPRQRMKDHEFTETWEDTKKRIRMIDTMTITDKHSERAMCRQIGMVLHYLADYFTCPHNPSYDISMIQHSFYEGRQALQLRVYLHSPKAEEQFLSQKNIASQMHSTKELLDHIEKMHDLYLQESSHTPQSDCKWIMGVCACTAIVLASRLCEETENAGRLYHSAA